MNSPNTNTPSVDNSSQGSTPKNSRVQLLASNIGLKPDFITNLENVIRDQVTRFIPNENIADKLVLNSNFRDSFTERMSSALYTSFRTVIDSDIEARKLAQQVSSAAIASFLQMTKMSRMTPELREQAINKFAKVIAKTAKDLSGDARVRAQMEKFGFKALPTLSEAGVTSDLQNAVNHAGRSATEESVGLLTGGAITALGGYVFYPAVAPYATNIAPWVGDMVAKNPYFLTSLVSVLPGYAQKSALASGSKTNLDHYAQGLYAETPLIPASIPTISGIHQKRVEAKAPETKAPSDKEEDGEEGFFSSISKKYGTRMRTGAAALALAAAAGYYIDYPGRLAAGATAGANVSRARAIAEQMENATKKLDQSVRSQALASVKATQEMVQDALTQENKRGADRGPMYYFDSYVLGGGTSMRSQIGTSSISPKLQALGDKYWSEIGSIKLPPSLTQLDSSISSVLADSGRSWDDKMNYVMSLIYAKGGGSRLLFENNVREFGQVARSGGNDILKVESHPYAHHDALHTTVEGLSKSLDTDLVSVMNGVNDYFSQVVKITQEHLKQGEQIAQASGLSVYTSSPIVLKPLPALKIDTSNVTATLTEALQPPERMTLSQMEQFHENNGTLKPIQDIALMTTALLLGLMALGRAGHSRLVKRDLNNPDRNDALLEISATLEQFVDTVAKGIVSGWREHMQSVVGKDVVNITYEDAVQMVMRLLEYFNPGLSRFTQGKKSFFNSLRRSLTSDVRPDMVQETEQFGIAIAEMQKHADENGIDAVRNVLMKVMFDAYGSTAVNQPKGAMAHVNEQVAAGKGSAELVAKKASGLTGLLGSPIQVYNSVKSHFDDKKQAKEALASINVKNTSELVSHICTGMNEVSVLLKSKYGHPELQEIKSMFDTIRQKLVSLRLVSENSKTGKFSVNRGVKIPYQRVPELAAILSGPIYQYLPDNIRRSIISESPNTLKIEGSSDDVITSEKPNNKVDDFDFDFEIPPAEVAPPAAPVAPPAAPVAPPAAPVAPPTADVITSEKPDNELVDLSDFDFEFQIPPAEVAPPAAPVAPPAAPVAPPAAPVAPPAAPDKYSHAVLNLAIVYFSKKENKPSVGSRLEQTLDINLEDMDEGDIKYIIDAYNKDILENS